MKPEQAMMRRPPDGSRSELYGSEMKSITAAVLHEPGAALSLKSIELDEPRDDEILVRIVAAGICHTDISAQSRIPTPAVLGHEGAGIVEEIGSAVTKVKIGDPVVLTFG